MSPSRHMQALFEPRAVAIVGATPNRTSITGQPVQHLIDRGYRGAIYPVNPKYPEISGLRCYETVAALPTPADLAVIVVSASRVPDAVAACGERGIPVAIVISGGFAELGAEGVALQAQVRRIAHAHGMRVLGPNCQGMLNVTAGVCAGFGPVLSQDYGVQPGGLSFITQSGGFGFGLVNLVAQQGLGFRCVVSTGNEADLTAMDFIAHFIEDEGTRVIAALLEGLNDGRRLRALGAAALERDKPLLLWKTGETPAGQRAAATHTASIAGDAAVCRAVFRQIGAVPLEDAADLADYTRAFSSGKRPAGSRIAVFSASGGAGVLMCDEAVRNGLALAVLSTASRDALAAVTPALGSLHNPIDVMGRIYDEPDKLRQALLALVADPGIDALVVINPLRRGDGAAAIARAIAEASGATDKPVMVSWAARRDFAADALRLLHEAGVPYFETPVRCARALGALARYAQARRDHAARSQERPAQRARPQADALAGQAAGGTLPEHAAKRVLAAYGIRTTREVLAHSVDAAQRAAQDIGYPVALKVQSEDIAHKTEAGAVRLDVGDARALAQAYEAVLANAARHAPGARIEGVLVQEMVRGGVETILGVTRDPAFGPVVMFGMGGIYAEVLGDVAFRLPPLTHAQAHAMIAETRCHAILAGARGRPECDIAALAQAIVDLGRLAVDLEGDIADIDVNPLAVMPRGGGVIALDALMRRPARQEHKEVRR